MRQAASLSHVLDLDLDFFLTDCCPMARLGERPSSDCCDIWPERDIRTFLEKHCGLSRERPTPGRIFETHDFALDFWKEQLDAGLLSAPFSVVHVDAHSDLGIAPPGAAFVQSCVLGMPPQRRADIRGYRENCHLTEANYLLFALGFRYLADLVNVRNPKSRPDIPASVALRGEDDRYIALHMPQLFPQLFERMYGPEPRVPFHVVEDFRLYQADAPFDLVSLAMSPRYTPREADALAEIFQEYILLT